MIMIIMARYAEVLASTSGGGRKGVSVGVADRNVLAGVMCLGLEDYAVCARERFAFGNVGEFQIVQSKIADMAEIYWQLSGEAGARQLEGAQIGLAHNVGGNGQVCCVNIARRR